MGDENTGSSPDGPSLRSPPADPVLVTGGGGFIGAALAKHLLLDGHQVRVLARRPAPDLERSGATVVVGDVRDQAAVGRAADGCRLVFHLAAKASLGGRRRDFASVNVDGTANVVRACREQRGRYLIHASTPSVVHTGQALRGVTEAAPLAARRSHYAATKAAAERLVLAAHGSGIRTVALRPHAVWGPGDRHLLPRLIERARRGQLRRIGRSEPVIDLTYIDNAVDAHILAANALQERPDAVGGRAYFVSDGTPVHLWDVVERVLEITGDARRARRVPRPMAYGAAYVVEGAWRLTGLRSEPPLTRYLLDLISEDHWFDISAAVRDMGYAARVGFEEGFSKLAAWLSTGAPR